MSKWGSNIGTGNNKKNETQQLITILPLHLQPERNHEKCLCKFMLLGWCRLKHPFHAFPRDNCKFSVCCYSNEIKIYQMKERQKIRKITCFVYIELDSRVEWISEQFGFKLWEWDFSGDLDDNGVWLWNPSCVWKG